MSAATKEILFLKEISKQVEDVVQFNVIDDARVLINGMTIDNEPLVKSILKNGFRSDNLISLQKKEMNNILFDHAADVFEKIPSFIARSHNPSFLNSFIRETGYSFDVFKSKLPSYGENDFRIVYSHTENPKKWISSEIMNSEFKVKNNKGEDVYELLCLRHIAAQAWVLLNISRKMEIVNELGISGVEYYNTKIHSSSYQWLNEVLDGGDFENFMIMVGYEPAIFQPTNTPMNWKINPVGWRDKWWLKGNYNHKTVISIDPKMFPSENAAILTCMMQAHRRCVFTMQTPVKGKKGTLALYEILKELGYITGFKDESDSEE